MIKKIKVAIVVVVSVILLLLVVGSIYLFAGEYMAGQRAQDILNNADNLQIEDNVFVLSPPQNTDTAFIFYPGAKVEATAYLPLLQKITQELGIMSILVEMPLNYAIFNPDAADEIINDLPNTEHFYIGGHSLGSSMASTYAEQKSDTIDGLIVLGGYVYGDYPPEKSLTVYGTFNSELEQFIDYDENIVVIEGGNHAQFGDYGPQDGDPPATISAEEQEDITVAAIKDFIVEGRS